MPAAGFVRPLEDAFQPVIDAVLKRRGSPTLSNLAALAAATLLAKEAQAHLATTNLDLRITTRTERLAPGMKLPVADLVVLGQVLSELDVGLEPAARVAKHAALVRDLLTRVVADDGALVIVEPALRERTRHLHAVRDALTTSATVFAPCLHRAACPMLATATEWCHEDLPVDLPPWLVPLARAAGLRYQGLTFTHLVLRRDDKTLVTAVPPAVVRFRVVSELLRSKGKAEVFGCTEEGARVRLRRLDRDKGADAATATWDSLGRGDVVGVSGAAPIDERGRVNADAALTLWPARGDVGVKSHRGD